MKRNKIYLGLVTAATVSLMPACSSDYLDVAPETSVDSGIVSGTVQGASLAINGICNSMQTQYQGTEYNQYNGESWLNTTICEALGPDYISGLGINMWGSEQIKMGATWDNDNYVLNSVPWSYCYNIINQANTILEGIESAEGDEKQRDFVHAQALTFRAFGYTKLLMYYAPRWENSRNGEYKCAVLRVEGSPVDVPLCTMNDVLNLIYKDLDKAIELYNNASEIKREKKWQPDLSVAQGIYARAALIKHDWAKAQQMAHDARQGYSIMDNNTYFAGFFQDNDDFMWEQATEPSDIYYWSWGCHYACNGQYVKSWGIGAGAIDMELFRKLDENDVRRKMFLTPDKAAEMSRFRDPETNRPINKNPGRITEKDFWDPVLVEVTANMNLGFGPINRAEAEDYASKNDTTTVRYGMYPLAILFSNVYGRYVFTGDFASMMNDEGYTCYYTQEANGKYSIPGGAGTLAKIPFGAQYKFWANQPFGTSAYPFMRASEMCLVEAEAAYMAGDETTALRCLKEINDVRIPGYSFAGTGEALLEEIRLCRRIELWGEGHGWTDLKRWNIPLVRKAWVPYDETSGNQLPEVAVEVPVDAHNGWRMLLPRSEYEYNHGINRDELEK